MARFEEIISSATNCIYHDCEKCRYNDWICCEQAIMADLLRLMGVNYERTEEDY